MQTLYVDFDAATNGTGTSGNPHDSIQAAITAATKNLTTSGGLTILCRASAGGRDTTQLLVSGFTNESATNFVTIKPDTGYEPSGAGPELAIEYAEFAAAHVVKIATNHTVWDGIDIIALTADSLRALHLQDGTNDCKVRHCGLYGQIAGWESGGTGLIGQNLFIRARSTSYGTAVNLFSFGSAVFTNCVFAGSYYGLDNDSNHATTLHNCLFYGNSSNGDTNGSNIAGSHNATSKASAPGFGSNWVTGVTSAAVVNAATNDFRLTSGSVLKDAGVSNASTPATDMFGTARPYNAVNDIGYHEFAPAPTPFTGQGSAANLAITGAAGVLARGQVLQGAAGHLAITGYAGTLTLTNTFTGQGASGHLGITGRYAGFAIDQGGFLDGASDPDGDPLCYVITDQPDFGTLAPYVGGAFLYTRNAGYYGIDSFTYRIYAGGEAGNTATIELRNESFNFGGAAAALAITGSTGVATRGQSLQGAPANLAITGYAGVLTAITPVALRGNLTRVYRQHVTTRVARTQS